MPPLLGNTYNKSKALPKLFRHCLINRMHLGEKLKKEAERLQMKPADVAKRFNVKSPSVYDWYEHGRIHKKHYPTLVKEFGKPIEWWLDFESVPLVAGEERAVYRTTDPRHKILNELFDALPAAEQDELIRTLAQKKQHYDALIQEMLARRSAA